MNLIRLGILFGGLLGACGAGAHHASAGIYDRNTMGAIDAEISFISWRNPHVRFGINRIGENGEEESWEIEFGSVNTVERFGIGRDLFSVGDRVTVSGLMGRDGLQAIFARSITMPDGEELPLTGDIERRYGINESALRDARNADAEQRADIFRVWLPVERPNTGSGTTEYPLTEAGRAAQAEWDPAEDPALRCIPPGVPTAMDNPHPIQFVDQGDTIFLLVEEWEGLRAIHMNGTGTGEHTQLRMGYSEGRWDGDTLVVETTDIGWRYVDDLGTPQSEDAVMTERFSLSSDGIRLAWEARITDPVNFTEQVVMEGAWVWLPGHEIKPFNCLLPVDSG